MRKPKVKIIDRYQKRNKPQQNPYHNRYYILVYPAGDVYLTFGDNITFRINKARLFDTVIGAWFYRLFRFSLWYMTIQKL